MESSTAETADFLELVRRTKAGDSAAAALLARTYESDIRIAARVYLGPALRPYFDSMDLVQSVHRSLLAGLRVNKLDFEDPAKLIALAVMMVRRKVARQWRRHRHQSRPAEPIENTVDVLATLNIRGADPTFHVDLRDSLERMYRDLDDMDRRLLELRLAGWTTAEVAAHTGHSPEALRIRLHRLRQRLASQRIANEWL